MKAERDLELLAPGHRACPGCGTAIATRLILKATGPRVIVVTATGCLETFTSPYGQSAWEVPWMHSLFENAPAVATGIQAALEATGRDKDTKVVAIGGDGSTFDIGFGALSGMFERGNDITYVCYDNEAYMNTGIQRSSATPIGASTTTTPHGTNSLGKEQPKKDLPAIALAHGIPYVSTASICYPQDLINKVKKALSIRGPKYLQVHAPCWLGWGFDPVDTVRVARLAVLTGLVVLYEAVGGEVKAKRVGRRLPVDEYLKTQVRFKHLFEKDGGRDEISRIQALADANARRFGLDA
ncbi:MAG: thiamine pyrophosphate-dependent enzyme [Actinobacteria bacterium]|nr:thiamine pyrophosphate-dependent enzyme [Actinomycetota bacterium]